MISVLMVVALISAAPAFDLQLLDGKTTSGSLVEISAGRVAIDTRSGRESLDTATLLSISAKQARPASRASDVIIELTDGSIACARQCVVYGATASITASDGTVLEMPSKVIRTIRLQPPSESLDVEWTRLTKAKIESDLLIVRKGASLDYHQGVIHDVTEEAVQFDFDGEILPVKRSKIYGLVYRHGDEPKLPEPVCRITDSSGSQWAARSLTLSDKLHWTTPAGVNVSQPLDAIMQIDFSRGKIVYLSDLEPDSVRWTPYFSGIGGVPAVVEQFYAPRYDRGVDARPLQLGGVEYHKGLAIHSRTELMYRLHERYGHFQAIAGIDDAVRPSGKIRLIVRGDDSVLLDTVLTGRDAPRSIDLNVAGTSRLTIVVDFAEGFSAGDHLLLCNARLSK